MARRRPLLIAAIALAPAAALLTACGSSGHSGPAAIAGAASTSPSASPTSAAPAPPGAPAIRLPADVKVRIDSPAPGSATTNAVVADLKYAIAALQDGYAQGNGEVPSMLYAYGSDAGIYWSKLIKQFRAGGKTITGTDHFYDLKVDLTGSSSAAGSYCEDQRQSFAKNIKTGKVDRTAPSNDDFFLNTVKLAKTQGVWKVAEVSWKKGDRSCVTA